MKRLYGERGVEKIRFGREILGLQRRRAYIACACVIAVFAFLAIIIFAISPWDEADRDEIEQTTEASGDIEGESDTTDRVTGEELSGGEADDKIEDDTSGSEESTAEDPIVYKDFYIERVSVVNKTFFDISFVDTQSQYLTKFYDGSVKRPLVLILHTYTSDRYADSAGRYGVCAAGQALADELNSMGIATVYSSAVHDGDMNDPSKNAGETIEFYLQMYPSIKYVFDVGVMQEYDGDKIIATDGKYMGKRAAQIKMLVAGNNMTYGRNNLCLAVEIGKNLRLGDMRIAREIIYDNSIGNSTLTPYYLEIFIGSSGNSEDEAKISAEAFANAFGQFLS